MLVLHFRRNHQVSIEKKTSQAISRKIRGSRKPRAPRIAKQRKTEEPTGVPQGCTAVHPGQKHAQPRNWRTGSRAWTHGRALVHGHPCIPRTTVRGCTATRAPVHGRPCCLHGRAVSGPRAVSRFFGLLFQFCVTFLETFPRPFREHF